MKLFWCEQCKIPVYKEKCPLCHSITRFFAADARPVFPEEVILIEILLHKKGELRGRSVWNAKGNRYFVDGEKLDFSVQEVVSEWDADLAHRLYTNELSNGVDYENFNEIIERFIEANSERLKKIEYESLELIKKVSKYYQNRLNVVSFSGGKDSTVVSSLVRRALGTSKVLHIFGNTTLEFPLTEEYVKEFRKYNRRIPFLTSKSERNFFEVSDKIGPPSRVMRWCCTMFKTGPLSDLIDRFSDKKSILTFYGIRRSESTSRSKYDVISRSPKIAKQLVVSPIIDWHDIDVWLYMLTYDEIFNRAYRIGFSRVGCWVCPSNSDWAFFLNKIHFPQLANHWRDFLIDFARRIGKPDAEVYVDSGNWKARHGGNGMELDNNQITFEPCANEAYTRNFILSRPITKQLYEYFKPFGYLDFERGRALLGEVYIWGRRDKKREKPLLILQGKIGQNHLKVIADPAIFQKQYPGKGYPLFEDWVDCQLRKYQSCIICGGCPPICKMKAISLLNDEYRIDSNKCVSCMECIAHYDKGCLVSKVTQTRRTS